MTENDGYQPHTSHGARIRADVVDVYVFARVGADDEREHGAARAAVSRPYEQEPGWEGTKARRHGGTKGNLENGVVYFLQVLRSGPPLADTWHPVMGHVEAGETSVACAVRECREELGLDVRTALGFFALEQMHPFYIAAIDTVVMSPRFCVEVPPSWSPALNDEHARFRWVRESEIEVAFMWPGQKAACREVLREIVRDESVSREWLRVRG